MKTMYEQVYEFNDKILHIPFPETPGPMSDAFALHLEKALYEEATEFIEGHTAHDFIKQIDSCIDSVYFALGGLYKLGLSPIQVEQIFAAVHQANMTKKKGKVAHRNIDGAVDAMKPEDWVSPEEAITKILDGVPA